MVVTLGLLNRGDSLAVVVLGEVDEILAPGEAQAHERDLRFVNLGRYRYEVRVGEYLWVNKMKPLYELLKMKFPNGRGDLIHHDDSRARIVCPQAAIGGDGMGRAKPMAR